MNSLRRISKDGLVCGILGVFIEAFAGVEPKYVFIIGGALFLLRSGYLFWDERKQARDKERRAIEFTALRSPDDTARIFAQNHNLNPARVVGKVIEICSHGSLESMSLFNKLGVEPCLVHFGKPLPKDFSDSLCIVGGLKNFGEPNRKKYGIAALPLFAMDNFNYQIEFWETDWNTWMSVRKAIESDVSLRQKLSHVLPGENKLPQSMSLQYIVRFANGDVLAMKRSGQLASDPGSWSFSGEEQLGEEDFRSSIVKEPAEHLFRRAFIEEVFGNRTEDENILNQIWTDHCLPIIDSHRVWSFFLEENVGIFQMFGVFQLKINWDKLRSIHELAVSAGWGSPDPEGLHYIVIESDIAKLLTKGECPATSLYGSNELSISATNLHATSRYRLWRLFRARNRNPASPT